MPSALLYPAAHRPHGVGLLQLRKEERGGRTVAPGVVSALLRELARAPEEPAGRFPALRPGQVVGRFELVRELGRGGFGVVFEARDRELGREVAFKALRIGGDAALKEDRLLREAEAAARLSHPNIVTLFDVGRCEHGAYLVMELLRGGTLAERLAGGAVPLPEALRIAREVAKALAHAHGRGVIHRDLTPGNVFLCEDGPVKVLDLGMAHAFGRRKLEGGTPAYMAPEQRRGAPEDERSDVFALGLIAREMLSGERAMAPGGEARPRDGAREAEPAALGALLDRMLDADPVARPRDAAEVLAALEALEQDPESAPPAPGPGIAPARRGRRTARLAAALAAAAAVATALGIGAARLARRPRPAPAAAAALSEARPLVAVADFVNETRDPELDGLSVMLITSLEQSRRLAVVTRSRMVDLARQMGREPPARIDEALGKELAARAGARTLVLATLHRFDDVYAVDLLAVDPTRNDYLFALSEKGRGKSSVPDMIDRLSEQARVRLKESPRDVEAARLGVARATTTNLEAFQHYFRGEQLAGEPAAAVEEYRKAVALDPGFALAQCQIAYYGEFIGLPQTARTAALKAALERVESLPDKERRLVLAWKAQLDGREDEAHDLYARAAAAYPDDKVVQFFAGDILFHAGKAAEAAPWFDRAFQLDPSWAPTLGHLPLAFAAAGRAEELLERAQRRVSDDPGSAAAQRLLGAAALASGRWDDAAEAYRRALSRDGAEESRRLLASALLLLDRPEEAEAVARGGPAGFALVDALVYQGRRREALAALESLGGAGGRAALYRARRLARFAEEGDAAATRSEAAALATAGLRPDRAAVLLALAGDAEGAAAQAAKLSRTSDLRALVEVLSARRRSEREATLAALLRLSASRESDCAALASLALGEMAVDYGRDADATAALARFRTASAAFFALDASGGYRPWAYPRSLYLEAFAHHRLGEEAEAHAALDRLLALFRRADPDLPLARDAAALARKLAPAAAR
jgi:tetratricopeptide (TPR) repeat protein